MTIGAIDPYDVAIRVDLGEIQETDLPKIFSGDTKGLAECKRYLYKLRSDRILYTQFALVDLMQKLKIASDPKTVQAAIAQSIRQVQDNIAQMFSNEWIEKNIPKTGNTETYITTKAPKAGPFNHYTYSVWASTMTRTKSNEVTLEEGYILAIKNKAHGSIIEPIEGWNTIISKELFDKTVARVRQINHVNANVLGTAERRKVEAEILENKTIPFMFKMWDIGVIGDILTMFGKALGGNL